MKIKRKEEGFKNQFRVFVVINHQLTKKILTRMKR